LTVVETECNAKGWDKGLEEIKQVVKTKNLVSPDFKRRPYDSTFLSTINWYEVVGGFYKADNTRKLIALLARKEEEEQMIADAIVNAAKADEDEFYKQAEPIPDDENDWEYCPEPDVDNDPCPDYTAIYHLHSQIVNKECQLLSVYNSQDKKKVNKVSPTRKLKELLNGTWFDEFSKDKKKYTKLWREEMVDELMRSDFGYDIAQRWKKKYNIIKYSLIGALKDVGVLDGTYIKIAEIIDNSSMDKKSIADYMGSKGEKNDLKKWLKYYLTKREKEPKSEYNHPTEQFPID
jgi:hypothetical protein